jgi:hypothetical protein
LVAQGLQADSLEGPTAKHERSSTMTAIENLRALKLQLEQQLKDSPSAVEREWIEGELTKIDIALSFLHDAVEQSSSQPISK